jgi:hypothetical protein
MQGYNHDRPRVHNVFTVRHGAIGQQNLVPQSVQESTLVDLVATQLFFDQRSLCDTLHRGTADLRND